MKSNNNFKVQMLRVKGDLAPFVKVEYVDQDAKEHSVLMVADSCSCHNILIGTRAERHGVVLQKEEGTMKIGGAGNEMVTTSLAKFHFVLGGEQFYESFCIKEGDIQIPMEIEGMPIIGILGNLFMQQYRLAIDYSDYTLHISNVTPSNLPISACDFFFPMEIGLERYGLPVLAFRQNGNDVVALADTGATDNMIALQSMTDNGFDYRYLGTSDTITGIDGETEAKDAMMKFCLLTLTESETDVVHHEDVFKVTPHYMITPEEGQCDKNGVQLPPVVGIIGSPFMAKEGWVLDFGIKYIYKRKMEKSVEMIARVDVSKRVARKEEEVKSGKCEQKGQKRLRFFSDATETGLPLIRIEEGDFEGIVMLIDTGSNDNIIFGYAYHQLEDLMKPLEVQSELFGIDGKPTTLNCVSGVFTFCEKEYEMPFLLREDDKAIVMLSQQVGFPISGIIGTKFMAEHDWIIDFGKQEVIIPETDISTLDWNAIKKK